LIPRSVVTENNNALQKVLKNVTENGVLVVGVAVDVATPISSLNISNAVLPAWRDALVQ
jgi:hypothetical protein